MSNPLSNRWTLKINIMNANGAMADRDWSPESDAIDNEEIKTKVKVFLVLFGSDTEQ